MRDAKVLGEELTRIISHQPLYPAIPHILHVRPRGIQIRQRDRRVAEPAVLNVGLVVVVADRAVRVEVFLVVEGGEDGVVDGGAGAGVALVFAHLSVRLVSGGMGRGGG